MAAQIWLCYSSTGPGPLLPLPHSYPPLQPSPSHQQGPCFAPSGKARVGAQSPAGPLSTGQTLEGPSSPRLAPTVLAWSPQELLTWIQEEWIEVRQPRGPISPAPSCQGSPLPSSLPSHIHVQLFMWTYHFISLACTSRSGMAESYSRYVFNCGRNSQIVSKVVVP